LAETALPKPMVCSDWLPQTRYSLNLILS
jgi:hypothetical protein